MLKVETKCIGFNNYKKNYQINYMSHENSKAAMLDK
jgi:hypothetical protein